MVKYLILTNKQCVKNHTLKLSQNSYMHRRSRAGEKHPVGQNFRSHHQDEKKRRQTYRGKPMLLTKAGNEVHLVTRYSQHCLKCLRELMPEQPLVCFERMQQSVQHHLHLGSQHASASSTGMPCSANSCRETLEEYHYVSRFLQSKD